MQQRINRVSSSVLVAATVGGIIWVSAGDLTPPCGVTWLRAYEPNLDQ